MNQLYPCKQAEAVLAQLASDGALRERMLKDPQATLAAFGFDVAAQDLPCEPHLAAPAQIKLSAATVRRTEQENHLRRLGWAPFLFK